ncbi:MAG: short-chain dehydrogenase, partial [Sphingomonadales bacterium]
VVAEGAEAAIAQLRRSEPNALFDRMSAMVQAGYAAQMKATTAS